MSQILGRKLYTMPDLGESLRSIQGVIMSRKGKSTVSEIAKKLDIPVLDTESDSNGIEVDFVTVDEAAEIDPDTFNGLSDSDAKASFSFSCNHREYDVFNDAHDYHVTPDNEYGDLDFIGKIVVINGVERLCDTFTVDDNGKIVIKVRCRTDD